MEGSDGQIGKRPKGPCDLAGVGPKRSERHEASRRDSPSRREAERLSCPLRSVIMPPKDNIRVPVNSGSPGPFLYPKDFNPLSEKICAEKPWKALTPNIFRCIMTNCVNIYSEITAA